MKKYFFPLLIAAMAVLSCGSKEPSPVASKTVSDPYGLHAEALSEDSALLRWEHDGAGVEGWWVFVRTASESVSALPVNQASPLEPSARSYVFEGLKPSEPYSFGVKAKSASTGTAIIYSDMLVMPGPMICPVESEPVTLTADQAGFAAEFRSKSVDGEDVMVTLGKVSANKTVQIDRYSVGGESFQSYTDWIGPYHMKTVAPTTQTDKLSGFVGGWHASNGDGTGDPTAVTESIEIFLDDSEFPSGTETGAEAKVVVHNKVEALNTKLGESKRFVILEDVTYTFKESRLYVRVDITALEDVKIAIYYGMQIANGFCSRFTFKTDDGTEQSTTANLNCSGKVRDMTGYSTGGHCVIAHMFDEGLGTYSCATSAYSALTQYYGANNGKGYYMLIGDMQGSSNSYTLTKDSTIYWSGYYEFR